MLVLSHRGNISYPENTIKAIINAIELGVDGVEIDIQKTLDQVLVLSHDENLKRVSGIDFNIRENRYEDLKKIKIQNEKIPRLDEVIELIKSKGKILDIEVKNRDDFKEVYDLVKKFNFNNFIISSFWHENLINLKKYDTKIKIALLFMHEPSREELIFYKKSSDFLKPNYLYISEIFKECNYILIPWTVNDLNLAEKFKEIGVFAIISDYPEKIKEKMIVNTKEKDNLNEYIRFFLQMIDKNSIRVEKPFIIFNIVNHFLDLNIYGIEATDCEINLKEPFIFKYNQNLKFEIKIFGPNPKLKIKTREFGMIDLDLIQLMKYF